MIATAVHLQETINSDISPVTYGTSILAAGAALLAVWTAVRTRYRATIGRRADHYRRLARLGTGAQLPFFTAVLGEPPAMQRTVVKEDYAEYSCPGDPNHDVTLEDAEPRCRHVRRAFVVAIFIDRDYYVETVCDGDRTVLAFSVTTRSKRFAPRYQILHSLGPIERLRWRRRTGERYRSVVNVKLGRTTFAELDSQRPEFSPPHFKIAVGAHNHFYSEFAYFGNPGHYQWFVWSATDAARQGPVGPIYAASREIEGEEWPTPNAEASPDWSELPEMQRFRRKTAITTYTVVSNALSEENYPLMRFGPNENDVRTIP